MSARIREHATYQDLLKVPDNMVAELIEGELFASPRPRIRHAEAQTELATILRSSFGRGGGGSGGGLGTWHILIEPELHLEDDVLVPDIAGWRVERVGPRMPDVQAMTIAPDWVCEILSPSSARLDRARKLPVYASHGIPHSWIVAVDEQVLEVKRLENRKWTDIATFAAGDVVRAEPFDAIEIDMTRVWGPPPS
ncbi:MAG TPA: Uma2 family endonuclease [Thermoanaerobaculia bacterium]|nr:Uma2 family endonuclease [Thermoanaerobaculia bacterium]